MPERCVGHQAAAHAHSLGTLPGEHEGDTGIERRRALNGLETVREHGECRIPRVAHRGHAHGLRLVGDVLTGTRIRRLRQRVGDLRQRRRRVGSHGNDGVSTIWSRGRLDRELHDLSPASAVSVGAVAGECHR